MFTTVGARLLLLLLLTEIPLGIFTVAIALQNDRLRASDALSEMGSLQRSVLAQTRHDLHVVGLLVSTAATLPTTILEDRQSCDAVLRTLVNPNRDRIAHAVISRKNGIALCSSDPGQDRSGLATDRDAVARIIASPRPVTLEVESGALSVGYQLFADLALFGTITIQLKPVPIPMDKQMRAPQVNLWLRLAGRWLPLGNAPDAAEPAATSGFAATSASLLKISSRDGRLLMYASAPLNDDFAGYDAVLIAGSDIRAAVANSSLMLMARLLEIAGFFACELVLIVAGVRQVVTRPLRQLGDAVQGWRASGSFSAAHLQGGAFELRELAKSFTQATESLDQREQELRDSIVQQDLLMQEIHHRVKNNLQIVASLLNLQASRIKVPEARAEFQSARDRVRALATLHRYLYANGELHSIDMRAFFAELCSQLFQALGEPEGDRISVQITAPDIGISSDQAVPIALIVTETVGNAIKYAFPSGRRGVITVSLDVGAEDIGTLVVADNGVGGVHGAEQDTERRGLGLQLVRGFARQLNATLSVTHEHGTCYHFILKLERQRPRVFSTAREQPKPA